MENIADGKTFDSFESAGVMPAKARRKRGRKIIPSKGAGAEMASAEKPGYEKRERLAVPAKEEAAPAMQKTVGNLKTWPGIDRGWGPITRRV